MSDVVEPEQPEKEEVKEEKPDEDTESDHDGGDKKRRRNKKDPKPVRKNAKSSSSQETPQSRFKGVYYVLGGRWESKITFQSKTRHIGTFDTEIQAALAFDAKAHQLGVPHRSNFLYDRDGNVISTDMVEPFRGVRRTRDKWRAVGAAEDGQSINLGTFDSRREAMEECNRWAAKTTRPEPPRDDPFSYRRAAQAWGPTPVVMPYAYCPVARRHGNSSVTPPIGQQWPMAPVYAGGPDDEATAAAAAHGGPEDWSSYYDQHGAAYDEGEPSKKRRAFAPPPPYGSPRPHYPVGRPVAPVPQPYWGPPDAAYVMQQRMRQQHADNYPRAVYGPAYHTPAAAAPIPDDDEEEDAAAFRPHSKKKTKRANHVLNGPTFYGATNRDKLLAQHGASQVYEGVVEDEEEDDERDANQARRVAYY